MHFCVEKLRRSRFIPPYTLPMPETIYGETPEIQEPSPQPAAKASWQEKLRQRRSLAFILIILGAITLILYWNRPQPAPVVLGASEGSIAISPDGKLLLVGTLDGVLRLVNTATGHTLAKTLLPGHVQSVTFGPGGTVLALVEGSSNLFIFSNRLDVAQQREVPPNTRDVVWSQALNAAAIVSGGADDIHPSLEFFPAEPLGIAHSTSQLVDLTEWSPPVHVAVSADGSRVGITLATNRRANVLLYDPAAKRVAASDLVPGIPRGIVLAHDASRFWLDQPDIEAVSEIDPKSVKRIDFPKSASTSPLAMLAVNEATGRAYTTGAVTFPEVDLAKSSIARKFELPTNSAGIALSPDSHTAFLTFKDANKVGVLNLDDMTSYREIELR
jgi:DNA-binding beta-propeller fold protein YncE